MTPCWWSRSWTDWPRSKDRGQSVHGAGRAGCTWTGPCAFKRVRRYLRRRGITARIARIGVDFSERLDRHRWVVERTISWLLAFRRLAIRCVSTAREN